MSNQSHYNPNAPPGGPRPSTPQYVHPNLQPQSPPYAPFTHPYQPVHTPMFFNHPDDLRQRHIRPSMYPRLPFLPLHRGLYPGYPIHQYQSPPGLNSFYPAVSHNDTPQVYPQSPPVNSGLPASTHAPATPPSQRSTAVFTPTSEDTVARNTFTSFTLGRARENSRNPLSSFLTGGCRDNSNAPQTPLSSQAPSAHISIAKRTPNEPGPRPREIGVQATIEEGPLPANPAPCVQICPHETVTFSRLQRILALPNFKHTTGNQPFPTINALTVLNDLPAHTPAWDAETRTCRFPCDHYPGCQNLTGKLYYQWSPLGLNLHSEWTLTYFPSTNQSKAEFRTFLDQSGVWLCPHRKISHEAVAKAVYGNLEPREVEDPIERYVAEYEMQRACSVCGTEARAEYGREEEKGCARWCRIKSTRFLGTGGSADDPFWLEQCGVQN